MKGGRKCIAIVLSFLIFLIIVSHTVYDTCNLSCDKDFMIESQFLISIATICGINCMVIFNILAAQYRIFFMNHIFSLPVIVECVIYHTYIYHAYMSSKVIIFFCFLCH